MADNNNVFTAVDQAGYDYYGDGTDYSDCWTYPKEKIDELVGDSLTGIETTKEEAIAAVQEAGSDAVQEIEEKGEETLESIPDDYTQLSEDVSELKTDLNETYIPYTWLNGYYALGTGVFTTQTGNVTYHSTEKIDGAEIPGDNYFIHSTYLYLSDSFFAVWNGDSYAGYLMNHVWHNPGGSTRDSAPIFTKYAVVLHNVSNYAGFGRRKYALISETYDGIEANVKSSMLVNSIEIDHDIDASYPINAIYGYKLTKKIHLKSYTPYMGSASNLYMYVMKLQNDGSYSTYKTHVFTSVNEWTINDTLEKDDAILLSYIGNSTQYFSTSDTPYFTKTYGWNASYSKLIESSLSYNIPGIIKLYDPVTNYLLPYIDNGNPLNWKGTECSVFDKILCIGDSITQGAPTPPDITPDQSKETRTVNNKEMYSYPASMKKQWGVTCTNWGKSGSTSQGWYDYYSVEEPSWSGHDAAIILIGNNDYHLVDDLGGLTSETLPIAVTRSKTAMMSIITKLKADNADIKIFICTLLPGWDIATSLAPYVCENIRDIAEDEDNVYLIDLSEYSIIKAGAYMYTHPTAIGYNQLAREIGGAIGYTIVNNPDDFKWIQFIGTEYAMDGE